MHTADVLDEIAGGSEPFAFVDAARRERAGRAVGRAVDVILRTQMKVNGRLTAWCAQHDEATLEPRGARTYEHPSLSGAETVGIVRFLMRRGGGDPRTPAAVEAAVAWLDSVKLRGWRLVERRDASLPGGVDKVLVQDASAPPLWARFYDIKTNTPIYSGRDGVIRATLAEIEHERRVGYAWVGDWPRACWRRSIRPGRPDADRADTGRRPVGARRWRARLRHHGWSNASRQPRRRARHRRAPPVAGQCRPDKRSVVGLTFGGNCARIES